MQAQISRRFENEGGRRVELVDAEVNGLSAVFRDETRTTGEPKVRAVGLTFKTEDGRRLHVNLPHELIDWIVDTRASWDEKYGR